jgi:hypothetical protein
MYFEEQAKSIPFKKEAIISLLNFIALIGVAVIVPMFHNQLATGPIINAVLFIATIMLGIEKALFICLIPSVVAISVGLLPVVLAPAVPFIMISNVLMVLVFNILKEKNYWAGVIASSFLKFIFLYSSSFLVVNLVIGKELASNISLMMGWPQLLTALAGGVLAFIFLKIIKKV